MTTRQRQKAKVGIEEHTMSCDRQNADSESKSTGLETLTKSVSIASCKEQPFDTGLVTNERNYLGVDKSSCTCLVNLYVIYDW